jgi:FkbM family methyltransferase
MILLLKNLQQVTSFTQKQKIGRVASYPAIYLRLLYLKFIKYNLLGKSSLVMANTFWNELIQISLPSSSDIFITGCKTHDSEVRLCKYLIANSKGKNFLDIGAHIGFFSLLVNFINEGKNKIIAIEPSINTLSILQQNTRLHNNITMANCAIGNANKEIVFYEFPEKYAENNTANVNQFSSQQWFAKNKPTENKVKMITGDDFVLQQTFIPEIIKIDVEGSENIVIEGFKKTLSMYAPIVIMEFFNENKNNASHGMAEQQLFALGYQNFMIDNNGVLIKINENTNHYFTNNNIDSDNIVYIKK